MDSFHCHLITVIDHKKTIKKKKGWSLTWDTHVYQCLHVCLKLEIS